MNLTSVWLNSISLRRHPKVSDEALKLADDLANINKAKSMWQFEEAAKHIRELSQKVKELQKQLDALEKK